MSTEKPRRLGRGLEALLSARTTGSASVGPGTDASAQESALRFIPLTQIRPNSMQPRKGFAVEQLHDLEASIRLNGLLQPITVRAVADGYEIIAGERRFRAIQRLGWHEIPAVVRKAGEVGDRQSLTLALVENLQRADLNPIEEADGYHSLVSQFSLTQQEVADVVGKDRSTVANTLRLLALPVAVRRLVRDGALSLGHARALLAMRSEEHMSALAGVIVSEGLSVREVERRVRETAAPQTAPSGTVPGEQPRSAEVKRIEAELRRRLQTDVTVQLRSKGRGELRIAFYSAEDLERLLDLVFGAAREVH